MVVRLLGEGRKFHFEKMMGPGKYDDLTTYVREKSEAHGVIVIIVGGNKGEGFSCQADIVTLSLLPKMLRDVANQIEKDQGSLND